MSVVSSDDVSATSPARKGVPSPLAATGHALRATDKSMGKGERGLSARSALQATHYAAVSADFLKSELLESQIHAVPGWCEHDLMYGRTLRQIADQFNGLR